MSFASLPLTLAGVPSIPLPTLITSHYQPRPLCHHALDHLAYRQEVFFFRPAKLVHVEVIPGKGELSGRFARIQTPRAFIHYKLLLSFSTVGRRVRQDPPDSALLCRLRPHCSASARRNRSPKPDVSLAWSQRTYPSGPSGSRSPEPECLSSTLGSGHLHTDSGSPGPSRSDSARLRRGTACRRRASRPWTGRCPATSFRTASRQRWPATFNVVRALAPTTEATPTLRTTSPAKAVRNEDQWSGGTLLSRSQRS